ncbi:hypothetical protein [Bacillus sp. AFS019443]|uniref:hypothetical protein n=1 Tax=Bacillus sp. AFS019443 TaxID=2034279 RepID=UPI000BF699D0|nr:hypothetical protein [Bacillus sp. AFS019443]PEU05832.1 hypothetical protein CN524_24730 [Bacillus sp. AFS019443]
MKDLRKFKKEELIEILVKEFGYEKTDLKGKVNIELKEMIQKEEQYSKKEEQKQNGISTFADDYIAQVMCSTSGEVTYESDVTRNSYVWTEYGDTQNMTYRELAEIKRRHPRYLNEGWLFILNEDVRAILCGDDSIFIKPDEVERIFDLPTNEMAEEIRRYKHSAYEVIGRNAFLKCKNGQISDLVKIKALVNEFGFHLEDFLES